MVDLDPFLHPRRLDLDEITDMRGWTDLGAGAKAREGADGGAIADPRALDMTECADFHIVPDRSPGAKKTFGPITMSRPSLVSKLK